MAAALAGFYEHTKVAHIEEGLRSGDKLAPFPEEINRRIVSQVADLHFAPTSQSREHLITEGVDSDNIVVTGNTVVDAMRLINNAKFEVENSQLRDIPWQRNIILTTVHRRENFGQPLENIC